MARAEATALAPKGRSSGPEGGDGRLGRTSAAPRDARTAPKDLVPFDGSSILDLCAPTAASPSPSPTTPTSRAHVNGHALDCVHPGKNWGHPVLGALLALLASAIAPDARAESASSSGNGPGAAPAETKGAGATKADSSKKAAKDESSPIPPSLSLHALCEELSRSSMDREEALKKLAAEREAIKKERAELEKLAKEVADAREQLKAETDRLVSFAELGEDAVRPGGEKFWPTRIAQVNADGGKSFENLAKTLKSMRPEGAAAVVARLDRNLAAAVLQRLRPADSSPILDRLKPEVAAELFGMIAADGAREARK